MTDALAVGGLLALLLGQVARLGRRCQVLHAVQICRVKGHGAQRLRCIPRELGVLRAQRALQDRHITVGNSFRAAFIGTSLPQNLAQEARLRKQAAVQIRSDSAGAIYLSVWRPSRRSARLRT